MTWADITKEYNTFFESTTNSDSLRKRFKRDLISRDCMEDGLLAKAIRLIKREPIKSTDLARQLALDLDGLESLLDDLQNSRSAVKHKENYLFFDKTANVPDDNIFDSGIITNTTVKKFGVISDTHCCSINEQPHILQCLYDIFDDEEVSAVFHAGDMTAGNGNVFKGQISELKIFGVDKQIDYICNSYPMKNFPTFVISGNHDMDAYKNAGVDIVKSICDYRDDLQYVGKFGAWVNIEGLSTYLLHGDGGSPVARSYKPQKLIDGFNSVADITIMGHWHVFEHLPVYRGTVCILPGCTESQTDYLRRKGLAPNIGGAILTVKTADIKGKTVVLRHSAEFINLEEMVK